MTCRLFFENNCVNVFRDSFGNLCINSDYSNYQFDIDFVSCCSINGENIYKNVKTKGNICFDTRGREGSIMLKTDWLSTESRLVMKLEIKRNVREDVKVGYKHHEYTEEEQSQGIFYFELKQKSVQLLEQVNNCIWSKQKRLNEEFGIYQKYIVFKQRDWFISCLPYDYTRSSFDGDGVSGQEPGVFFCNSGVNDLYFSQNFPNITDNFTARKYRKVVSKHAVKVHFGKWTINQNDNISRSIKVSDKPRGSMSIQDYINNMSTIRINNNNDNKEKVEESLEQCYTVDIKCEHLILTNNTKQALYVSMVKHPLFRNNTILVGSNQSGIIGTFKAVDLNNMPMNAVIALVQIKIDNGTKIKNANLTVSAYFDAIPVHRSFELYMDGPLLTVRAILFENPELLRKKVKEIHESFIENTNSELDHFVDTVYNLYN